MESINKRGFASDNNSGVHPNILKSFEQVNIGHTIAYGDDIYTQQAVAKFKEIFGDDIDVFFVFICSFSKTKLMTSFLYNNVCFC